MEIVAPQPLQSLPANSQCLMSASTSVKLAPPLLIRLTPAAFRLFASSTAVVASPESRASDVQVAKFPDASTPKLALNNGRRASPVRDKKVGSDVRELKLNWLDSLSCPLPQSWRSGVSESSSFETSVSDWVIGVDPDLSGALAVLKPDDSAEVFDSPFLKVPVGKRVRRRLDVKSIIELLRSIDAPSGTTVYLEQSIPFPRDGKQGWWSGGFGYGLWIGILVASGYSVVPVPSFLWKNEFNLARSNKDDSRELASTLFPPLTSLFKRKKDHGRAEALLIAAYGKGLKVNKHTSNLLENLIP